jgi:predicted RND superfamily exporter protein
MQFELPVFFNALLTNRPLHRKLRIMLRSHEHLGADQKSLLIEQVESTVARHTSSNAWQAVAGSSEPGKVTGYYVMMARLVGNLIGDQWRCFLASGLLVWVLLMFATRSFRLATAAMLPNLLPVLVVLACVGLLGGKINMGAAMIAAVSIGLSIDGSVHFLASYQRLRLSGHSSDSSAIHAGGNIGVPVLLATIALVIGFSVLASSEFVPTATFGLLVASTLFAGTLINLTLLPSFISWVDRG